MNPGDDLNLPYCGEKYIFDGRGKVFWRSARDYLRIPLKSGYEEILDTLRALGKTYGSFRVLPDKTVAAKLDKSGSGCADWPVFVTTLASKFAFNAAIDPRPAALEPGDIWTSFYDGARFSYLDRRAWWQDPSDGRRKYWADPIPLDLLEALHRFKPLGGSFRVTQDNYVVALRELPQRVRKNYAAQFDALSDVQQRLVLTYLRELLPAGDPLRDTPLMMMPIYVGTLSGMPRLTPKRDFAAPLSTGERAAILEFLTQLEPAAGTGKFHGVVDTAVETEDITDDLVSDVSPALENIEQHIDQSTAEE